jgi:hypothetical protein
MGFIYKFSIRIVSSALKGELTDYSGCAINVMKFIRAFVGSSLFAVVLLVLAHIGSGLGPN